ncbi:MULTISPECIES: methyl-accepting chemotaxis protein [unclassified Marinobacter]|uniref:methyl-accepting chemotaxis protein n=1 Tax=unclassified Marinobacter TaxID=83889 RepID=UPI0026E26B1F|nr:MULTISPECIES: methyl-accepting chemotaxis protein [unclassified Marinobacter]MDO6441544.1 methyl-accepting chemotaxis protein [Marinobacter sp. 2_MG-2023]MDO6822293.1 methyl-accepting chemotaxis protein [Marinobacter sp. 1_MG-2023]
MNSTDNIQHLHQQELLRADRRILWLLLAHVPVVGLLVPWGYGTYSFAVPASLGIGALAIAGYNWLGGTRACGVLFSMCLMLFSATMIQAQLGRIEMHFHIFAALALTIAYRDWLPVVAAAAVIAIHHLVLTALQLSEAVIGGMPLMLFNYGCSWSITALHAAFVVFEGGILSFFAIRMGAEQKRSREIIALINAFDHEHDLRGRLENANGDLAATAFNTMVAQFGELIESVRGLSRELHSSAAELTAAGTSTNRIIEEQRAQTDQAAAATNEMTATIQDVARNAQSAAESASRSSEASAEGTRHIQSAMRMTEATNTALTDSSRMVSELVEKVESIGTFIASINDISDQTNLLALNAAIEAARAGEHGRGFAVVADEVRNLSRRTQAFTTEIRATIDGLANVSEGTLAAIEMGQTRSRETLGAMTQTGKAIADIEAAIAEVNGMNLQIASATEQQAVASGQINQSVQQVAEQSQDVVEEAAKSQAMAVDIGRMIAEVDTLIAGYKTR